MADSYSTFLMIRLPATGAYNNTWGATLNSDAFQLLDIASAGWTTMPIGTSVAFSMPALNPGGTSASLYYYLLVTGTPAAAVTMTVPSNIGGKPWLINNQTGQALTFTYGGSGRTVTVAAGELRIIYADGTNCDAIIANSTSSDQLGGVPAANWMRASRTAAEITASTVVRNQVTVPIAYTFFVATDAPTITIDCNNGNEQQVTLSGNRVMATPANATDGSTIDLWVIQDGTGTRTLSWSTIFWFENGTPPVLGTAAGSIDRFAMVYNASLTRWVVGHFANANSGSGVTAAVNITVSQEDWSLLAVIGTPSGAATYNINVAQGVVLRSSSTRTPAMDLSGLVSGSVVNLVNAGYIQGHGGDGADGAAADYPGSGATVMSASAGQNGGIAINGPGSGVSFNVTNANGNIWGGGGGGGGGGAFDGNPSEGTANAAGAGGGAGGGKGGKGGRLAAITGTPTVATNGTDGTFSIAGTFGTAGTNTTQGSANVGTSGAGGTWGAAGTAGTAAAGVVVGHFGAPSAAGTGGNAINLRAGSITWVSGSGSPNVQGAVS